jgi:Divergent InlB B-repeat domain
VHSSHRCRDRFAVVVSIGLSLLVAACWPDGPATTGVDAQVPPGTGLLVVTRDGAATGTVSASPAGIDCGATCSAAYSLGAAITLTATPDAGARFAGWSGSGCTGSAPTCTVAVDAVTGVNATFDFAEHPVTIDLGGSGDGVMLAPSVAIRCPGACTGTVRHGEQVSLAATSSAGSRFLGWTISPGGTPCPGTGPCSTTITGPTTITATFARPQSLEVTRSGNGTGTVAASPARIDSVAASPARIDCGTDCSEIYPPGTAVTLVATAAASSVFTGWSGGGCAGTGPCTVEVNAATLVTAGFALRRYDLTVTKTGTGTGAVMSEPAGINCGSDCGEVRDHGTPVTLTAIPAAGSVFTGWSGGCTGTGPCTVPMTAAASVAATFALAYPLSVTRSGNGSGTVTSSPAGIDCGADCDEMIAENTAVTLTATPAIGSYFAGWLGGGCAGTDTCTVTMTAATSVTAVFTLKTYTLSVDKSGSGTVTSSPSGIDCGTDCSEELDHGTTVTLTATPATGSAFTGWSGGGCSGTGACTVTMTAVTSVTATFAVAGTLRILKGGNGDGTVTGPGISCGTDCEEVVTQSTGFTLTATPAASSYFAGWTGPCSGTAPCTVTVAPGTTVTVTASFTLKTYTLSVAKSGTGSGTVTSSPPGINCGADCSESFDHGTQVTLTATPATGSVFTGWSGGCTGMSSTCTVNVTSLTNVTATFTLKTYTLSVVKDGTGSGTVTGPGISCGTDCSESFNHGTPVTLTATPANGAVFAGWSGGGCAGTGACTVTMTAATTVMATFTVTGTLRVITDGTGSGTVISSAAGIQCSTDCSYVLPGGTTLALTTTPAASSVFAGWGGGCTGTGTCTVAVIAGTTVTVRATFTLKTYTLSVLVQDITFAPLVAPPGTVTSSPAGISCGLDCSQEVTHGNTMTLTATPRSGYKFYGWSGGGCSGTGTGACTVTVTAPTTVMAMFVPAPAPPPTAYTLSVNKTGTGSGVVSSSPSGINCGSDCSQQYNAGTTVTLYASPASGSIFNGWGGACIGTGSCTVSMSSSKSVTASFTRCVAAGKLLLTECP